MLFEQVLQSDKDLVLTTLASHTSGNPPAIDQIEVFAMRKDKFGWVDKHRRAAQVCMPKEPCKIALRRSKETC